MKNPILYIIIPCYNEESVLPITSTMFLDKINELVNLGKISDDSRIMFVNDGSKDKTWEIICDLANKDKHYIGISQSRNRGHQNAVLAGLMEAKDQCDITISIDCDGQDDINAMNKMVDEYLDGCEVVYGVRSKRDTDTFFKRFTAEGFYHLMNWMGAEVVFNHADYRLISSRVLQEFANFKEVNIFLRGMIPLVGFKSTSVYYERHERIAGEKIIELLKQGHNVAYASDAGTPGISDPGDVLVDLVREAGFNVVPIPGPAAFTTLVSVAGTGGKTLIFEGFLSPKSGKRRTRLKELLETGNAVVIYESPFRIVKLLADIADIESTRRIVVGRELTKLHEEISSGTALQVFEDYSSRQSIKGEFAVFISGVKNVKHFDESADN